MRGAYIIVFRDHQRAWASSFIKGNLSLRPLVVKPVACILWFMSVGDQLFFAGFVKCNGSCSVLKQLKCCFAHFLTIRYDALTKSWAVSIIVSLSVHVTELVFFCLLCGVFLTWLLAEGLWRYCQFVKGLFVCLVACAGCLCARPDRL